MLLSVSPLITFRLNVSPYQEVRGLILTCNAVSLLTFCPVIRGPGNVASPCAPPANTALWVNNSVRDNIYMKYEYTLTSE